MTEAREGKSNMQVRDEEVICVEAGTKRKSDRKIEILKEIRTEETE